MQRVINILIIVFVVANLSSLSAQICAPPPPFPLTKIENMGGDLTKISSQLIDCKIQPDSSEMMIHCKKTLPHYPKPVHFYIPTNLDTTKQVETFVHFHGHNIGWDHFLKTNNPGEGYGDYGAFLANSKVNGIVAIAESDGHCSTYDQFFSSPQNSSAFFDDIKKSIKAQKQVLHLSGHSGAYRVLNRLAKQANEASVPELKDVHSFGLFDATYGSVANIEQWMKNKKDNHRPYLFYNTFVDGPLATASKLSLELQKKYQSEDHEHIIFKPVSNNHEKNGVKLHFNVLRDGSLQSFFESSAK